VILSGSLWIRSPCRITYIRSLVYVYVHDSARLREFHHRKPIHVFLFIIKARTHGVTFLATLRATVAKVGSSFTSVTVAPHVVSCDTPKNSCYAQRFKNSCILCLGLSSLRSNGWASCGSTTGSPTFYTPVVKSLRRCIVTMAVVSV